MRRLRNKLLAVVAVGALLAPPLSSLILPIPSALAGTSTITVLDSTSTTRTFAVTTNGASNFIAEEVVCDGTAAAQCAAVKAASTAAVAADPALVVAISPNSPLTVTQGGSWSVTANAGTNLNTSTLATSANQATNAATTAHTCSTGGFSELGCLGQIDDDIKSSIAAGTNVIGYVGGDGVAGTPSSHVLSVQGASGMSPVTTINNLYVGAPTFSGGNIATTNTFQSLLAANTSRRSCDAQNQGTHNMFFQITATNSAPLTTTSAKVIAPATTVVCNDYIGDVMQGYVWITGTAGDAFQVTQYQ